MRKQIIIGRDSPPFVTLQNAKRVNGYAVELIGSESKRSLPN